MYPQTLNHRILSLRGDVLIISENKLQILPIQRSQMKIAHFELKLSKNINYCPSGRQTPATYCGRPGLIQGLSSWFLWRAKQDWVRIFKLFLSRTSRYVLYSNSAVSTAVISFINQMFMYIIATSFDLGHLILPLMFITCDFA